MSDPNQDEGLASNGTVSSILLDELREDRVADDDRELLGSELVLADDSSESQLGSLEDRVGELSNYRAELKAFLDEHGRPEDVFDDIRATLGNLRDESIDEMTDARDEFARERDRIRSELSEVRNVVRGIEDRVEALMAEVDEIEVSIGPLRTDVDQLHEEIERLDDVAERADSMDRALDDLAAELEEMSAFREHLLSAMEAAGDKSAGRE